MIVSIVVLICTVFVSPLSCDGKHEKIYDEFVNEVINIKKFKNTIRNNLPKTEDGDNIFLSMLDASTIIPSGIMAGNFFDLGHFDECYSIKHEDIYGKYCLGVLPLNSKTKKYFDAFKFNATRRQPVINIHPEPRLAGFGKKYTGFHWAACIPSTVPAANISVISTFTEDFCYSKATEPSLSDGAIATIVVLAVFLAVAFVSTVFDIFLFYTEKQSPHELLIAFSFLTNGRKIFKSTTNPDQLLCLNGIRAISMMWVILGHEYSLSIMGSSLYNFLDVQKWQNDPANMLISGATVSVDTFFVIGGMVTVYTFLKAMDRGIKFNIILYYVHRYLRLTPALAIMALIYTYLLNYLGNGPLWKAIDITLADPCKKGWWSTLLYITNFVQEGICLPQGWYLSVDMQLYIVSPILLIPLYKWPKPTLGMLVFLAIVGCVVPFAVAYSEHLGWIVSMTSDRKKYMNLYYMQSYTRFGPYVIGMILGFFIYKIKDKTLKVKMSKTCACVLWLLTLTGLVACVYAGYPLSIEVEEDRWGNSMYIAFNRPAWSVALCGVILLCVSGYGHPVDKFLSLPIFQFLTKVSYSMYLVHYAVITVRNAAMKNTFKFSNSAIFHVFWADFMVTLGLSLVLCLLFESPIIILEKHIFGHGSPKRVRVEAEQEKPEV